MYRGIYNLRSVKDEVILNEFQTAELDKCRNDPEYFLRNYCYIHSKDAGMVLFNLRPKQVEALSDLKTERMIKSDWYRQSGYTTLGLLFMLWKALFFPKTICLYMVPKKELASGNFSTIVREAYIALPFWMQQGVKVWKKNALVLANGSLIYARAASADNARGIGWDYIFIDEFGWIKDKAMVEIVNTLFVSVKDSVRTHLILAQCHRFGRQTPANLLFWENTTLQFHESVLTWDMDDQHDAAWAQKMRQMIGYARFDRDYCGTIFKSDSDDSDQTERFGKWTIWKEGRYPAVKEYQKGRYLCTVVALYFDTGLPACEPFCEVLTVDDNGHFCGLRADTVSYQKVLAWMPLPDIPKKIMELVKL